MFDKCTEILASDRMLCGLLGESPLHVAAAWGNDAVMSLVWDKRADVHSTDLSMKRPLAYAVFTGQADAARSLLERGAEVRRHLDSFASAAHSNEGSDSASSSCSSNYEGNKLPPQFLLGGHGDSSYRLHSNYEGNKLPQHFLSAEGEPL